MSRRECCVPYPPRFVLLFFNIARRGFFGGDDLQETPPSWKHILMICIEQSLPAHALQAISGNRFVIIIRQVVYGGRGLVYFGAGQG